MAVGPDKEERNGQESIEGRVRTYMPARTEPGAGAETGPSKQREPHIVRGED